ncbi:MAG: succinylglutamate desuccinylase/aspartoacylase family protein [Vicingaceae bacterium]
MISENRLIGHIKGDPGPCLIMIGGVHGNEPSGVSALQSVCEELKTKELDFKGNFYALYGNLGALKTEQRFIDVDLNRLWHKKTIDAIKSRTFKVRTAEDQELLKLYHAIRQILDVEKGPFYFIDLHTTSAQTIPFLTVNDTLLNRRFTLHYPAPIILGIEEYIQGPLLSYINELGYVAFGFEGGQHQAKEAFQNHYHFIHLSMEIIGMKKADPKSSPHFRQLQLNTKGTKGFYEIVDRFGLKAEDQFEMLGSYQNFECIEKGEHFANYQEQAIEAEKSFQIFMPLYQSQGSDGYFSIKKIIPFFLNLSAVLRTWKVDGLLAKLPGIKWYDSEKSALLVNHRIARFFTKQIFHLLGYRSKIKDQTHWLMYNREYAAKYKAYKSSPWISSVN